MSSLLESANKNALKIFLVGASIIIVVFIIAVNLKEPVNMAESIQQPKVAQTTQPNTAPLTATQPKKPEPTSEEYSKKVKELLKKDFKTVDAYLEVQGSTRWLFITIGFNEWSSMGKPNQKEMVMLLLRHMRQNYSDENFLQVSITATDQAMAEGKWSPLGNPEIELIGE